LLSEDQYYEALDQYGEGTFTAMIGAEAIRELLKKLNLIELRDSMRAELGEATSEANVAKSW
jgi:DNA-directed RNA polymerase subunit beta'